MEEIPFSQPAPPPDVIQHPPPPTPRGTGIKKALILGVVTLVTLGGAAFILFGTKTAHNMGKRTAVRPSEAAPKPPSVGDPFRGNTPDYNDLLTKKEPPAPPKAPEASAAPAVAASQAERPAPQRQTAPKEKDQGMLVLEGKRTQAQRQAAMPQYSQEMAAPVPLGEVPKDPRPLTAQEGFMQQKTKLEPTVLQDRLHEPQSPFMVLASTVIPASLITGINSDLPGPVSAQVRVDVRDSVTGRYVLIPQGSRLIGSYDSAVIFGQNRVLMAWQRLILPDGSSLQLEGAPGLDVAGYSGLKDKVNSHFWKLLGAVLMSSALSVGARAPFGDTTGYYPTLPQQFAEEFASGANRAGQQIVNRQLQQKPTIEIRPGMSCLVFTHRDIVLRPWSPGIARKVTE